MHWSNCISGKDTITIDYDFYEYLLQRSRELDELKEELARRDSERSRSRFVLWPDTIKRLRRRPWLIAA